MLLVVSELPPILSLVTLCAAIAASQVRASLRANLKPSVSYWMHAVVAGCLPGILPQVPAIIARSAKFWHMLPQPVSSLGDESVIFLLLF